MSQGSEAVAAPVGAHRSIHHWGEWWLVAWGVLALAATPFVTGFWLYLFTIAAAKALVVLGLLLLMRTGLVSFGQGLYYAVGAYTVGMLGQLAGVQELGLLLGGALLLGGVTGAIIGALLCRYRGIFFAMFSLAVSMILYGVLVKMEVLGSTDGFNVVSPAMGGWQPEGDLGNRLLFAVAMVLVFGAALVARRYRYAPIGRYCEGVKENELRVEYLGVAARQVVWVTYLGAALLAATGGAITALATGHVGPEMAYWTTSGEFVFIALLGGTGHVAAALLGAVLFEVIYTFAFELSPYTWQLILGSALLLIILFLPEGLWSLPARLGRWVRS
ncbi:MAG: branched-chain amino acid ABC transporter permease [Candidatus Competibacterales bacterium]